MKSSFIKILICVLAFMCTQLCAQNLSGSIYTLDNGLKIFVKPQKSSSITSINFCVRVGPLTENSKTEGYSSVLAASLFNKTDNYADGQLDLQISKLGINRNFYVNTDFTGYTLTGLKDSFEDMVKLGIEGLFKSKIDESVLNKQLESSLTKIFENAENANSLAEKLLLKTAFQVHPYKNTVLGSEESLNSITVDSITEYYKRYYTPANVWLIIVGNVDEETVLDKVTKYSASLPNTKVDLPKIPWEPSQESPGFASLNDYVDFTYVRMGWPVPASESADKYVLHVIASLIGGNKDSYLWKDLVESKKVALSAGAAYYDSFHPMLFQIGGVTSPGKSDKFVKEVKRIIKNISEGKISESELQNIKQNLVAQDYFRRENVEFQAMNYGMHAIFGTIEEADLYAEKILEVTAEDIKRVVSGFFHDSRLTLVKIEPVPMPPEALPEMLTLKNGIRLILKENHDTPVVAGSVRIAAGSLLEADKQHGIANLTAQMLEKSISEEDGTSIGKLLNSMGVEYSIAANKDYVAIDFQCISSSFSDAFSLILNMIEKPNFDNEDFDVAKEKIIERIEEENTDIFTFTKKNVLYHLFNKTNTGRSVKGDNASVLSLTQKNVKDFHKKYYVGRNIVISLVGNFYRSEIKTWLYDRLSSFSSAQSNEPVQAAFSPLKQSQKLDLKLNKKHSVAVFASRSISPLDARSPAMDIAGTILFEAPNSRLNRRFSDASLYFSYGCTNESIGNEGYFYAFASVKPNMLASAAEELKGEIDELCENGFTEEEFNMAKSYIVRNFNFKLATNKNKAAIYSTDEIIGKGFDYFSKYSDLIAAVKRENVNEILVQFFLKNNNYIEAATSP
ncbi:MAG: insulinase family protein [Candidatus Riflebacteria bacterium]|nr:insulinase family protein [Candidatus Riflebacteria bacterium]